MAIDPNAVVATVKLWLGVPYVFGGASRSGIDCSGLVQVVYKTFGVSLPHHSQDQARYGTPVDKTAIQPGDLVFSDWGDGPNSHVGIAVSPTEIIDAPRPGTNVRYDTLSASYLSHVTAVRRLTDSTGSSTVTAPAGGAGSSQAVLSGYTDPISAIADAIRGLVGGVSSVGKVADLFAKLWDPSNIIRGVCFAFGAFFIFAGVVNLSREVRG